jgi:hypothetical protein
MSLHTFYIEKDKATYNGDYSMWTWSVKELEATLSVHMRTPSIYCLPTRTRGCLRTKAKLRHTFWIIWYNSLIQRLAGRMLVYMVFSKYYSVDVASSSTSTVRTGAMVMKPARSQISHGTVRNRHTKCQRSVCCSKAKHYKPLYPTIQ